MADTSQQNAAMSYPSPPDCDQGSLDVIAGRGRDIIQSRDDFWALFDELTGDTREGTPDMEPDVVAAGASPPRATSDQENNLSYSERRRLEIIQYEDDFQALFDRLSGDTRATTPDTEPDLAAPSTPAMPSSTHLSGQKDLKRKRTITPPSSPENTSKRLRAASLERQTKPSVQSQARHSVLRSKKRSKAPRRPITRSYIPERIALGEKRGEIRVWDRILDEYILLNQKDYWENYALEGPQRAARKRGRDYMRWYRDEKGCLKHEGGISSRWDCLETCGGALLEKRNMQHCGSWPYGDQPEIGWDDLVHDPRKTKLQKQLSKRIRRFMEARSEATRNDSGGNTQDNVRKGAGGPGIKRRTLEDKVCKSTNKKMSQKADGGVSKRRGRPRAGIPLANRVAKARTEEMDKLP